MTPIVPALMAALLKLAAVSPCDALKDLYFEHTHSGWGLCRGEHEGCVSLILLLDKSEADRVSGQLSRLFPNQFDVPIRVDHALWKNGECR